MRLKSAHIKDFKRFVELKICNLPSNAKLIVLLGPNGCGKSSLFDAFQKVGNLHKLREEDRRYYERTTANNSEIQLDFHDSDPTSTYDPKRSLYVRSAYRNDPSFRNTSISQEKDVLNRRAVSRMIDTDETVRDNHERILWRLLGKVTTPGLKTDEIMEETIGDLQKSMETIFEDVRLDALVSAQDTGTFTFTKGSSRNFLYENLSAGEKAAFDLLLDVVVNRAAFDNSLYCLDEPEAHLSTKVQGKILNELCRLVPENSQLWLATHSMGMVRMALEIRDKRPEDVVFLDMGFRPNGEWRDYDKPQTIEPADPDYAFWSRHYAVALDDMAELIAPDRIVLCEGGEGEGAKRAKRAKRAKGDGPPLDESCYNKIFAREFPLTRFISVGGATDVEKPMLLLALEKIIRGVSIIRFRDRDDLTNEEIEIKRGEGIRVMSERNIESMLLSDGVLSRLCVSHGKPDCFNAIKTARNNALNCAGGQHAPDDLKHAAQAVHQAAGKELGLRRPGERKETFMSEFLAPLVTADTPEYKKLKADIFGT